MITTLAIDMPVTTFTGRTGRIVKLSLDGPPEAARVIIVLPLQINGTPPILVRCRYHPADVRVEVADAH